MCVFVGFIAVLYIQNHSYFAANGYALLDDSTVNNIQLTAGVCACAIRMLLLSLGLSIRKDPASLHLTVGLTALCTQWPWTTNMPVGSGESLGHKITHSCPCSSSSVRQYPGM